MSLGSDRDVDVVLGLCALVLLVLPFLAQPDAGCTQQPGAATWSEEEIEAAIDAEREDQEQVERERRAKRSDR